MAQSTPANELTLSDVETQFGLSETEESSFFSEWQQKIPQLHEYDQYLLDRARTDFRYLAKDSVHEEIVKLVIVAPLLSVAGFYRPPFRPVAEKQVEIVFQENDEILRGRLDILVLNEQLWVTLLEAKNKRFNVLEALPQALFYMMSSPTNQLNLFGLATNGSEFLFIKLRRGEERQYALSKLFSVLNPGNDLYQVSGILQNLGTIVRQPSLLAS
ncbi:MAG: type I restriction endonuclease [Leptolyngbyaceae bacterium]|nr:type I restriction endonuclease [Leptolyngbyaceae bacterium]